MIKRLNSMDYFRMKVEYLSGLPDSDEVEFQCMDRLVRAPVKFFRDRFEESENWKNSGFHNSMTFPNWLDDYVAMDATLFSIIMQGSRSQFLDGSSTIGKLRWV